MTEDQRRLGSRVLAFGALWLLLTGLLSALSFVVFAFVATAILLVVSLSAGGIWLLRRFEIEHKLAGALIWAARGAGALSRRARELGVPGSAVRFARRIRIGPRVSTAARWAAQAPRRLRSRLSRIGFRRHVRRPKLRPREAGLRVAARANVFLEHGVRIYAIAAYWLLTQASHAPARLQRRPIGARSQALRLNAVGAQLRRRGDHEQAAEQHRVALAIIRDLGDEQAEALTLNNLALALAQGGAEAEAVEHLEQARLVLHELGDEEHEAQVIANLGIVHRRQGRSEVAETLLSEALDKLPPESTAYRQVEAELRRAS